MHFEFLRRYSRNPLAEEFFHVVVDHGDRQRAALGQLRLGDVRIYGYLPENVELIQFGAGTYRSYGSFMDAALSPNAPARSSPTTLGGILI